jgi:hypothetical protein
VTTGEGWKLKITRPRRDGKGDCRDEESIQNHKNSQLSLSIK